MTRCERKGCGGLMVAHHGAFKCGTCGEVDAPMPEKYGTGLFTPQELRNLAYWWRRQWSGYGEDDCEYAERYG